MSDNNDGLGLGIFLGAAGLVVILIVFVFGFGAGQDGLCDRVKPWRAEAGENLAIVLRDKCGAPKP